MTKSQQEDRLRVCGHTGLPSPRCDIPLPSPTPGCKLPRGTHFLRKQSTQAKRWPSASSVCCVQDSDLQPFQQATCSVGLTLSARPAGDPPWGVGVGMWELCSSSDHFSLKVNCSGGLGKVPSLLWASSSPSVKRGYKYPLLLESLYATLLF